MKKLALAVVIGFLASVAQAAAQNLVIANARIVDGKGGELARGFVIVRDGTIATVSAGTAPSVPGARVIDAAGRTVMPGFVDAHRHIVQGDAAMWLAQTGAAQMQQFLDAGFTTVVCAICGPEGLEMKKRINDGTVKGRGSSSPTSSRSHRLVYRMRVVRGAQVRPAQLHRREVAAAAVIPLGSIHHGRRCARRRPRTRFPPRQPLPPSMRWRRRASMPSRR